MMQFSHIIASRNYIYFLLHTCRWAEGKKPLCWLPFRFGLNESGRKKKKQRERGVKYDGIYSRAKQ